MEPGTENKMEILYSFMQPGGQGGLGRRFHVIITQRVRDLVFKIALLLRAESVDGLIQCGPGQARYAHWWNGVKMVMRVTSCFLIGKEAYSREGTPAWYCKLVRSP